MTTVSIEEAQAQLSDLIHNLSPGEEVAITENNRTVARIVATSAVERQPIPGRGKAALVVLSEDHDHLEDFKEHMR